MRWLDCPSLAWFYPDRRYQSRTTQGIVPLKELNAIGLQLESLSPLNSMPLESLALSLDGRDEDDFSLLKSIGLKRLRSPNDPLNQTAEEFFLKHKPEIRED